jgi:DNA-binding NtrC family response regulator
MEKIEGPIVIVDADDKWREFYAEVIKIIDVHNEIRFFKNCQHALDYLYTTREKVFIILAEVNLPGMSGLEMKETIQREDVLRDKAIPFVYISTDTSAESIRKAHKLNVQGYFEKPRELAYVENLMIRIFEYWECSKHINNT